VLGLRVNGWSSLREGAISGLLTLRFGSAGDF
jgi:hypothetical protein